MTSETCPKCAEPRFPNSMDCPYCGIVYDRYRGDPGREAPKAADTPRSTGGGPPGGAGASASAPSERAAPAAPTRTAPGEVPVPAFSASPEPVSVGIESKGLGGATLGMPDVYDGPGVDDPYPPRGGGEAAAGGRWRQPASGGGPVEAQPTLLNENLGISLIVVLLVAVAFYGFFHHEMLGVRDTVAAARQDFARLTGFDPPDRRRVDEGSSWTLAGYKVVLMEKEGARDDDFGLTVLVVHPGKFRRRPGQAELLNAVEARLAEHGLPFKRTGDRNLEIHGAQARSRSWSLEDGEWTYGSASALAFQAPDGKTALLVAAGSPGRVARAMREVTL